MKPWQMMRGFGQPASGGATDPYWANVVSLLHFDGAGGSTTFTDQKSSLAWAQRRGSPTLSTAKKKWGTACLSINTSSGKSIYAAYSPAAWLDDSDFTIEAWVLREALGSNYGGVIGQRLSSTSNAAFGWGPTTTNTEWLFQWSTTGTDNPECRWVAPDITADGLFHHIVVQRSGTVLDMYFDGVKLAVSSGYSNNIGTASIYQSTSNITVGQMTDNGPASSFYGYIDELRITKGVARYSSNFSPPSAPFPDS